MIRIIHTHTTWVQDYEVIKENMSVGVFRIILRKREGKQYAYSIVYGGEAVISGDTGIGRRIDAMRYAKHMLFEHVRYSK